MNTIVKIKDHKSVQIATLDNGFHCVVPADEFAEGDEVLFTPDMKEIEGVLSEGTLDLVESVTPLDIVFEGKLEVEDDEVD